jgi:hypothetical protein
MPQVMKAFKSVADGGVSADEYIRAAELYQKLPFGDFSRDILTACADKLAVLRIDAAGWGDLGTPEGVFAALQRTAPPPGPVSQDAFTAWLAAYRARLEGLRHQGVVEAERTAKHSC